VAEAWGVPPWVVEEQASVYWMNAFALLQKERERELERMEKRMRKR